MRAWQFSGTNEPLLLVEKDIPTLKNHEVLIEVKAAGLCHSDVGVLRNPKWMSSIQFLPITMGHEIAGVIQEVGLDVKNVKIGDRVGVCPVSQLGKTPGYGYDGGYADFVSVPAVDVIPIPDNVSFALAAIGTDAGMSAHHSLFERGQAKSGQKVGIIGIGGLGQNAARMAVIAGCEVFAVDNSPKAQQLARKLGVKKVYSDVLDLKEHQCEVIVDYAGFGNTTADAISVVKKKGIVVVVGMGKLESTIDTNQLILKEVNLLGSKGGTAEDISKVYSFYSSGKLQPQLHFIEFDEIARGLEMLENHEVEGRIVAIKE